MLSILLTILVTYVVVSLFGFIVHWSLHQPWAGYFGKAHMTHHLKLYPPQDFTSKKYRNAGKDDTLFAFALASIPMIAFPVLLAIFGVISWPIAVTAVVVELLLGFLHDWMHATFHIENHWLSRLPVVRVIFPVWIKLHYVHHVDMSKNYGIFAFHWDRVFGTYKKD